MIVLSGFDQSPTGSGGFVSIGNFDGVHRGHQRILRRLAETAHAASAPAVVLTFDPHPIQLLAPDRAPPNLSTPRRKAEIIERCGADVLLVMRTTHELLNLSPQEFFDDIVCRRLHARGMVEGPNFFFGHNRAGDVATLRGMCVAAGLSLEVVEPVAYQNATVSSSEIRRAVREGRIDDAVAMLGHPYQVEGLVTEGARRGREIGFPTANLAGVETLLPADGVYAATALLDGDAVAAAVHLGPNPTFGESSRKLEVHLVGWSGDLYGRSLRVNLLAQIRPTQKFPDRESLIVQLERDVARVQQIVAAAGPQT